MPIGAARLAAVIPLRRHSVTAQPTWEAEVGAQWAAVGFAQPEFIASIGRAAPVSRRPA